MQMESIFSRPTNEDFVSGLFYKVLMRLQWLWSLRVTPHRPAMTLGLVEPRLPLRADDAASQSHPINWTFLFEVRPIIIIFFITPFFFASSSWARGILRMFVKNAEIIPRREREEGNKGSAAFPESCVSSDGGTSGETSLWFKQQKLTQRERFHTHSGCETSGKAAQ